MVKSQAAKGNKFRISAVVDVWSVQNQTAGTESSKGLLTGSVTRSLVSLWFPVTVGLLVRLQELESKL